MSVLYTVPMTVVTYGVLLLVMWFFGVSVRLLVSAYKGYITVKDKEGKLQLLLFPTFSRVLIFVVGTGILYLNMEVMKSVFWAVWFS